MPDFKVVFSQPSTIKGLIGFPIVIIGVVLIVMGETERGVTLLGAAQAINNALNIALNDKQG